MDDVEVEEIKYLEKIERPITYIRFYFYLFLKFSLEYMFIDFFREGGWGEGRETPM